MLSAMGLVEQWRAVEAALPADWADARLELVVADGRQADRAAALLGPLVPGRSAGRRSGGVARQGAGAAPEALRRLLARLDQERIGGQLELVASNRGAAAEPPKPQPSLAEAWDAAVAPLPEDWSDLYCELRLTSSDDLDRGALLTAPLNPARYGPALGFRFRVARSFGYGASPQMARRCLARLDAEGIPGEVVVLRVLSDTRPVATQGPVWYLGGKVV
jgi:hypothetical protein